MTWPGSWLRYLLAWVGLVIVVAGWMIATIAAILITSAATADRRARSRGSRHFPCRGLQFWLRLAAALFVAFLFVVWFIVAITYPFPPLLTLASIPILTYVLLRVAQGPEYADSFENDPLDPGRREGAYPSGPLTGAVGRDPMWDRWIDG